VSVYSLCVCSALQCIFGACGVRETGLVDENIVLFLVKYKQDAQLLQTALQGGLVMAKSERMELGDNILRTL